MYNHRRHNHEGTPPAEPTPGANGLPGVQLGNEAAIPIAPTPIRPAPMPAGARPNVCRFVQAGCCVLGLCAIGVSAYAFNVFGKPNPSAQTPTVYPHNDNQTFPGQSW